MRRAHVLRRNHTSELPTDCVWVDTETRPETDNAPSSRQVLTFGWAAHRRRKKDNTWTSPQWYRFTKPEEFWEWVFLKLHGKISLHIFAHNYAYDAPVLHAFSYLPTRGWKLRKAVIDSPPIILSWRRGPYTLKMVDTLNIWRMPLAAVGAMLDLPKLPMPAPGAGPESWDAYGKRDVEIIMAAVLAWFEFLRGEDLGGFAPTLASQAMRSFRHRFMSHKVFIDAHPRALELARRGSHGGRTECFRVGRIPGPLHLLDINSMYPAIMREEMMPARLKAYSESCEVGWVRSLIPKYCAMVEADLVTDVPMYGVVEDNRLVFPVGKLRTVLTTPELIEALRRGHVRRFGAGAFYEPAVLFADYVDYFYKKRLAAKAAGDGVTDILAKLLMNSLYGKFGQRGRVFEEVGQGEPDIVRNWLDVDAATGKVTKLRQFAGVIQAEREEGESRDSHPAISAHVTGYGRMMLWRLIEAAGPRNVFYCDTDGLLVNDEGRARVDKFLDPARLGALKLVATYPWAILYGPKDYDLAGTVRIKGVKRSPYWLAEGEAVQDQFSGLKGLIALGDLDAPRITVIGKTLQRIYKKGQVQPGGEVLPFHLAAW